MTAGNAVSRSRPADPAPPAADLKTLGEAARSCQACPLYLNATQTVFGEGNVNAPLVIVGEQPGDSEDRKGRPFVGSAGRLLDRALADAGIDRAACYVTNAVKHFKWEPAGKRRLHKKPGAREIAACRPWLLAELALIRPRVLLCLGATALHGVMGRTVPVLQNRGRVLVSESCPRTLVTVHPSSILRLPDPEVRELNYALFVEDLRNVARLLKEPFSA